jgi:SPP1 gp7 family putative phage head morphogenesis protein
MARSYLPPELQRSRWQPTAQERRQLRQERQHFLNVRNAEQRYAVQLRQLARYVAQTVQSFLTEHEDEFDPEGLFELQMMLESYSTLITPWAEAVAERMITDVSRRDAQAWFRHSRDLGIALRRELAQAPIGNAVRASLESQVELIRSIPVDAGRRVQQSALDYASRGKRYGDLVADIRSTNEVTVNRATLIARTETAKAQSAIMQVRAKWVGSERYIWHTVRDGRVRPEHRELEGTTQRWDDPPVAEANGERHHPGNFPNCRCYAEPLLPEVIT